MILNKQLERAERGEVIWCSRVDQSYCIYVSMMCVMWACRDRSERCAWGPLTDAVLLGNSVEPLEFNITRFCFFRSRHFLCNENSTPGSLTGVW